MNDLIRIFGQDVEAVLLIDRWHRVGVWRDAATNEPDPDGKGSLEVNDDLATFIEEQVERRVTCLVSSILAVRWKPGA